MVLLYVILKRLDFSQLSVEWDTRLLVTIGITFCMQLVAQALSTIRWQAIIRPGGPRWTYLFRLYLIGNFFSVFLPTSIGGDAVRALAVGPSVGGRAGALGSVALDRLFGVAALGCYLLLGILIAPATLGLTNGLHWTAPRPGYIAAAGGALVLGGIMAFQLSKRREAVRSALSDAGKVVSRLVTSPGRLVTVLALSLLVQGTYILTWMALAAGLGLRIPPPAFLLCVPIVSLGAMLPVSFGGLGVREGAWLLLLSPLGIRNADIVVYSLLYFVAFVMVGAVGGILFLVRGVASPAPAQTVIRPMAESRPT